MDIVEQMRSYDRDGPSPGQCEVWADEIERLRAELAEARAKALEEAAQYHDAEVARLQAEHDRDPLVDATSWILEHRSAAAAIRALATKDTTP